ncbi:unnamed protein product [Gongylonema pulchrum]|uniref:Fibrous sheath-interacting protein 1 n=1 Tax=Gongylonema pulchrum TaxID=637853 RepID=A0A183DBG5_9BILA|nr:unnamed protein product [Gongylonema pulchrum]
MDVHHELTKQLSVSSISSTSASVEEICSLKDELSGDEKVYEGSPSASDNGHTNISSYWDEPSNPAAVSVVLELKERFGKRIRQLDRENTGTKQEDQAVEGEFQKRLPTNEEESFRFVEQSAEQPSCAGQSDNASFSLSSENTDTIRLHIKTDLKEAILFRKLAPAVCFADESSGNSDSFETDC